MWLFVGWVGFQLLGFALARPGSGGVAYLAHLGGAGVGVVFWCLMRKE